MKKINNGLDETTDKKAIRDRADFILERLRSVNFYDGLTFKSAFLGVRSFREEILRRILHDPTLRIKEIHTEKKYFGTGKDSFIFDFVVYLNDGRIWNVEIQNRYLKRDIQRAATYYHILSAANVMKDSNGRYEGRVCGTIFNCAYDPFLKNGLLTLVGGKVIGSKPLYEIEVPSLTQNGKPVFESGGCFYV